MCLFPSPAFLRCPHGFHGHILPGSPITTYWIQRHILTSDATQCQNSNGMSARHPVGQPAENKQPTFWCGKICTLLGSDMLNTGPVFAEHYSLLGAWLGCKILDQRNHPGINSSFLEGSIHWSERIFGIGWIKSLHLTVEIHADIKCCSGIILNYLQWFREDQFRNIFFQDVLNRGSMVCGTPLFPQHTVTCQRSTIPWQHCFQTFRKHTSVISQ